ncbi:hypothetical protein [Chryseobacterium schmidteae]|uniref:hypothetical protein n=1 Tax=Chryseobacterium schmidteae TaxID=2730404 RepID=UPI00158BC20A|nr:hypothetical protein [Chryseobacterium schmidteae]
MKKIVFFFIFPFLSFAQLSPEVNSLYQELSKNERYEGKYIGFSGEESKIYNAFQKIDILASDDEMEYIASNGNTMAKAYAGKILFGRKSDKFLKIYDLFLKNNNQIKIISGCTGYDSFLADEIYRRVFEEKNVITQARAFKEYKDSILTSKTLPHGFDKDILEEFKTETKWNNSEIDSLLLKMEKAILKDENSSQSLVELVCEYNFYTEQKKPYYKNLLYFEKKYNSEIIKQYIDYCK